MAYSYIANGILEERIERVFDELEICGDKREAILAMTNPLKVKDLPTWEHSARVGLKNYEVANYMRVEDPKAWFYIGFMHDVGKALTNPESLKKKDHFGPEDKLELDRHVDDGCRLLRGAFNFTAAGIRWHHYFSGGYPSVRTMPEMNVDFSNATELKAMYIGRRTGVIDFYDAITTRENDKFSQDGKPCLPTPKQAREILEQKNADELYFINKLYDAGILK